MTHLINPALKLLCLAVYAIALARLADLLPPGSFERAPMIAAALLGIHTVEAVLMFKHVRLYRGPLAVSIGLTVLFGLLHWKPLADRQARAAARP